MKIIFYTFIYLVNNILSKVLLCDDKYAKDIKMGSNITVCIHFNERPYRMAYEVTVDEYSVISIAGAYKYVAEDTIPQVNFIFQVAKNNTLFPTHYYDKSKQKLSPVFNVVIKVEMGQIKDVIWDNDCYACLTTDNCLSSEQKLSSTGEKITDKNCVIDACKKDKEDVFNCDPKFYITWFGTDVDGKQLKSSNLSMSRFRQYAVGSLYNSAKDAFNKTIDKIVSTYNDVANKIDELIGKKDSL